MKPFDIHEDHDNSNGERPRRCRYASKRTILFIFSHLMRGGNDGGVGVRTMAHLYGVNKGPISNYVRHVAWCLYKSLKENEFAYIRWPNREERSNKNERFTYFLRRLHSSTDLRFEQCNHPILIIRRIGIVYIISFIALALYPGRMYLG